MGKTFNIVMRVVSTLLGLLMICFGGIWILQGLNVAFLDSFNWTGEQMGAVMLDITQNGTEPFAAARAWLAANPDVVEGWLQ